MRLLKALGFALLLSVLAGAQVVVIGGTASNWAPGAYAAPFVPLVTTPSVSLTTISPAAAGASNATFGNVAGATNATLSNEFIAPPAIGVETVPVFYGTTGTTGASSAPVATAKAGEFNLGIGSVAVGVAQLVPAAGTGQKASRTYTNEDVGRISERIDQSTGVVKYGGKTEHF
jgi:hypothetical protein